MKKQIFSKSESDIVAQFIVDVISKKDTVLDIGREMNENELQFVVDLLQQEVDLIKSGFSFNKMANKNIDTRYIEVGAAIDKKLLEKKSDLRRAIIAWSLYALISISCLIDIIYQIWIK